MTKYIRALELLKEKMGSSNLDDADWLIPKMANEDPLTGFRDVPIIQAGDGGWWIPVYIYIDKEKKE